MTCLLNQPQHLAQIPAPLVQCLIGRLLLLEVNDARRSIDLCLLGLVRYQLAECTFGGVGAQVEELGESGQRYLGVV